MSKSFRLMRVLEAVERLGLASPVDVVAQVSSYAGPGVDPENLKRAVYRDLKDLADSGKIEVQYFTPDGRELNPEEWNLHKNVRTEYRLFEKSSTAVKGAGLIVEAGGHFVAPALKSIDWFVTPFASTGVGKNLAIVFEVRGQAVSLCLPADQFPARILFARIPAGDFSIAKVRAEVAAIHGQRTAVFFLGDKTVSRYGQGDLLGHCLVSVEKHGKMIVSDIASTSGTFHCRLSAAQIAAVSKTTDQGTETLKSHPLHSNLPVDKIKGDAPASPPCYLQVGKFRMLWILN